MPLSYVRFAGAAMGFMPIIYIIAAVWLLAQVGTQLRPEGH